MWILLFLHHLLFHYHPRHLMILSAFVYYSLMQEEPYDFTLIHSIFCLCIRFLGQTNDIGSSLLIRKKIFDGCLHCRVLNIHQSLTLIPRSSKKHWCSISRNPLFTLVTIDMEPPKLFLNILINWTAYN